MLAGDRSAISALSRDGCRSARVVPARVGRVLDLIAGYRMAVVLLGEQERRQCRAAEDLAGDIGPPGVQCPDCAPRVTVQRVAGIRHQASAARVIALVEA